MSQATISWLEYGRTGIELRVLTPPKRPSIRSCVRITAPRRPDGRGAFARSGDRPTLLRLRRDWERVGSEEDVEVLAELEDDLQTLDGRGGTAVLD